MCGIAGIFDILGEREIDRSLIGRMSDAIAHRGPDEDGTYFAPGLAFGHRRLSIIDLENGQQPMTSSDGQTTIVFNGQIYNFRELATDLEAIGSRFQTNSDTEVLLEAWRHWGTACVDRLRGMFAFAIWDNRDKSLFLARDRFGKKPLYYTVTDDGYFSFASELKSLRLVPGFCSAHDPRAIEDYFAYGYIPDPKTIYQQTEKLPPGHTLLIRRGGEVKAERYWDIELTDSEEGDLSTCAEGLIEKLKESVACRQISDVEIGAFLSGGVDSSAIVALLKEGTPSGLKSFSVRFSETAFDESAYAAQVAQRYETDHIVRTVDAEQAELIDRLAWAYDEPFADSSALPTYLISREASRYVKVCLSGDGSDELMAGYRRYRWHMKGERARSFGFASLRQSIFGGLGRIYPKLDWAPRVLRAKSTFLELSQDSAGGFFSAVSVAPDTLRSELFSADLKRELSGYNAASVIRNHFENADTSDALKKAQYADIKTYLPGDILTKVDRASMANSLEVRAPFLDQEFAAFAINMPATYKIKENAGKYALKRGLEPHLPKDILYRQKQGFSLPLSEWIRTGLSGFVEERLFSSRMRESGVFEPSAIRTIVRDHLNRKRDHGPVIWSLLMYDAFLRNEENNDRAN